MNIALIGYRGTGKSTVAKLLASRLGWAWCDTDDEVQRASGRTIAQIFQDEGEPAFRELEATALAESLQRDHVVLALGGGAVLREDSRERIRQHARTVWLRASVDSIQQRLAQDPVSRMQRPDLTSQGGRIEIEQLLAARMAIYAACADWTIDTDHRTPADESIEIECWYRGLHQVGRSSE